MEASLIHTLEHGEFLNCELVPVGSNYTFLATLATGESRCLVIYKPRKGEAPLWDFPQGTLYKREYAAYLFSQALGWGFIPFTLIRDGPYGVGSVQFYIEPQPGSNYFALREHHPDELRRIAVFDLLTNNADRKAGHCFKGKDGNIWGVDHGLTFHVHPKLRTVIWDFCRQPIPGELLRDIERVFRAFHRPGGMEELLSPLLAKEEVQALLQRMERLLEDPVIPIFDRYRGIPWPIFH